LSVFVPNVREQRNLPGRQAVPKLQGFVQLLKRDSRLGGDHQEAHGLPDGHVDVQVVEAR
jgi:hypothetical protein